MTWILIEKRFIGEYKTRAEADKAFKKMRKDKTVYQYELLEVAGK